MIEADRAAMLDPHRRQFWSQTLRFWRLTTAVQRSRHPCGSWWMCTRHSLLVRLTFGSRHWLAGSSEPLGG